MRNMLRIEDLDSESSVLADRLYGKSFPVTERYPVECMHSFDGRYGARYRCFTDDGEFVGLAFTIDTEDMVFVSFLAVEEDKRSRGYGSGMLEILKSKGKKVLLNMEPVEEGAENYDQRVRRRDFYMRNGFEENCLTTTPDGGVFMSMVCGGAVTEREIRELYSEHPYYDLAKARAKANGHSHLR